MKIGHPAPGVLDAAPPASAGSVRPATDEAARTAPAIGTDGTDKAGLGPVLKAEAEFRDLVTEGAGLLLVREVGLRDRLESPVIDEFDAHV